MRELNIFDEKYIDLFLPNDGVEFLHNVIFALNYSSTELSSKKARKEAMMAIEELLKFDLIEVFHWGEKHEEMKNNSYSNEEILEYINLIWFEGAGLPDFYGMIMFKHKDWYLSKLKKFGMTDTKDWHLFIKKNNISIKEFINREKSE